MNHTLWNQVQDFQFDSPTEEYGFATRLAYENTWTLHFTQNALLEYKKFMFLAATANEMVSPSEIVDIVWHQHLIFTQSYSSFCDLLGKKIAHIPSTHHHSEKAMFSKAKERTKQLYEAHFGKQPDEIWKYYDELDSLRLSKFPLYMGQIDLFFVLGIFVFAFPFYYVIRPALLNIDNPDFLVLYILAFVVLIFLLESLNKQYTRTFLSKLYGNSIIYQLHPFELLYMKTGKLLYVINGVVNSLIEDGKIQVAKDNKIYLAQNTLTDSAFENCVIETLVRKDAIYYPELVKKLKPKPIFAQIEKSTALIKQTFMDSTKFLSHYIFTIISLAVWFGIGLSRLFLGLIREKSIELLAITLAIGCIATIWFMRRYINYFVKKAIPNLYEEQIKADTSNYQAWEWQYFLLREATFAAAFIPLAGYVDRRQDAGNGGSCGSSCGSSDGGGGGGDGGGCGGCGGGCGS